MCVIGQGNVAQAKAFSEERELPYALYTDPGLKSFAAAGLKRGGFGLKTLTNAAKAMSKGFMQGATQGDAFQQGGAFVIAPGSRVLHSQVSDFAGDHVDPEVLLRVLAQYQPT